jgi:CO dehydrogenase/acetyl-CoA synthase alpha subunit
MSLGLPDMTDEDPDVIVSKLLNKEMKSFKNGS